MAEAMDDELRQRIAELERLILAMSEKIWLMSQHLAILAERKDRRNA